MIIYTSSRYCRTFIDSIRFKKKRVCISVSDSVYVLFNFSRVRLRWCSCVCLCVGEYDYVFVYISVVIRILLQSTAWYTWVKQHRPRLLLGWVTVLVCEFVLIVLRIRLKLRSPGAVLAATV